MPKPRMRFRPGDHQSAEPVIKELMDRFDAWRRARHPEIDGVDAADLDLLLTWKLNHGDGRFDTWTTGQLEDFLLDWCPRKVSVSDAHAALMPASVAEAFTFLASEGLLSPRSASGGRLAAHAISLASRFTTEMRNPAAFGLAKSILGGLDVDLDQPLTPERVDALMAEFNSLPFEDRKAITDPAFGDDEPDLPVVGPVRIPDDGGVLASAAAAPVLAGFTALAEYFRTPGRPLTAKGNIRLADAQALSEILGTETVEEKIGEHTFSRHTAARMPRLDHWQWWAREVGALRVRNGRMVGVEAWLRRRAKDPVAEARKAFDLLVAYGPVASYLPHAQWPVNRLVDMMTPPLLAMMLSAGGPVEFSSLVDAIEAAREVTGQRGTFGDPEYDRREAADTVDRLLTLLERAGVVAQHDTTHEATRFFERRTGGTVELTPFGVVAAVEQVRDSGVKVLTLTDPAAMTAEDVADLAAQQVLDPTEWLDILVEWVGHQPDRRGALRALLDALARNGFVLVAMLLPTPEALEEDFATVMQGISQTHRPDEVLGAVALTWLVNHDRVDVEQLSPETLLASGLTTLGLLAAQDPEAVPEAMGTGRPRADNLEVVAEASRRMPPNVEALLESIGRHHPDPVVAKSARKELLRVRSHLAHRRQNPR